MTDIDKELIRRLKAETVGRLVALGMVFAVVLLVGDKDNETTKASVVSDKKENVSVKQMYADSVRNVNAVKFDAVKSRTK